MAHFEVIHPEGWAPARGYSNGLLAPAGGRLLFVAGQVAWDAQQTMVGPGNFVLQFEQALHNVVAVVRAAGGAPEHLARLTLYVVDRDAYTSQLLEVGRAYRRVMGRHYPAMALVQVMALVETDALLEIEGTAVLPP